MAGVVAVDWPCYRTMLRRTTERRVVRVMPSLISPNAPVVPSRRRTMMKAVVPPPVERLRCIGMVFWWMMVRLLDGKRIVLKVRLDSSLADLAALIVQQAPTRPSQPFRLVSGFPPTPIPHPPTASIRAAGLQGAQIQLQKA